MRRPLVTRTSILVAIALLAGIVVMAFLIAPNPPEPTADGDQFTGRWLINGVDAAGVEYSGTLDITLAGEGYELQWIVTGGIRSGTGSVRSGRLVAAWTTVEGIIGDQAGAATYVVDVDGVLQGTTTVDGVDGTGSEEGFPAS